MSIAACPGRLHRVRGADARLDHQGSIPIDLLRKDAAGSAPFPLLHINGTADAVRGQACGIAGIPGPEEICLNERPARRFGKRDQVLSPEQGIRAEARKARQKEGFVNDQNGLTRADTKPPRSSAAEGRRR